MESEAKLEAVAEKEHTSLWKAEAEGQCRGRNERDRYNVGVGTREQNRELERK